ncbi:MAG: hypothetical protein M0Q38_15465 [Bacteroidales bacterium]|jgi:c-di-AMP phosphodiesterase-like protein|nr:hypothetical protein [Bacteroidales bacterium]
MKKNQSYKFPKEITDPKEILSCLTKDQYNSINDYLNERDGDQFRSMVDEITKIENKLKCFRANLINTLYERYCNPPVKPKLTVSSRP